MTVFKTGQHTRASAGSLALAADFIASFLVDQSVRSNHVPRVAIDAFERPRSCEKTRRANRACRRELPRGTGSLEETARQDRRDASTKPPTDFSYFAGPEIAAIMSTEATSNQQFRCDFFRFNQDFREFRFQAPTTPKKIYGTSG
jgi:hypothetical protein